MVVKLHRQKLSEPGGVVVQQRAGVPERLEDGGRGLDAVRNALHLLPHLRGGLGGGARREVPQHDLHRLRLARSTLATHLQPQQQWLWRADTGMGQCAVERGAMHSSVLLLVAEPAAKYPRVTRAYGDPKYFGQKSNREM